MPGFEAILVWAWVNFYNIGQICLIAISSFDYNLMHDLIVLGLRCVSNSMFCTYYEGCVRFVQRLEHFDFIFPIL